MHLTYSVLLILLLCTAAFNAQARQAEKWVDENGQVHYGDYSESMNSKQIKLRDGPRNTAPAQSEASRLENRSKLLESIQSDRDKKKEEKAKSDANMKVAKKNCSNAKRKLSTFTRGGRLVTFDENGERHYISDNERASGTAAAKASVDKWCK